MEHEEPRLLQKPIFDRFGRNRLTRRSIAQPSSQALNVFRCFFPSLLPGFFVLLLNAATATSAGPDYPNGFPIDPGFFPIGVWTQSPVSAPAYKAIGINTFVGLWKGPTEDQLATLAKYDMFVVASQNDVGLHSANRSIIKGWLHDDEPDNAQPIGFGLHGSCTPASEVVRRTQEMKAHDNTRPVMINFGQGIANEFWRGRGPCNGDENYYALAARDVDILSFDIYPVSSPIPQVRGKLEYVARGVTRLTNLARGIVYFVHEFTPIFREDAIFRHPDVVNQVANENELIKSLAPVLNSPNLRGTVTVQASMPIATMTKQYQNRLYIFAIGMTNSASVPRFTLEGIDETRALVIGEKRDVTITGGVFEDSFEGYGVHIYEISPD
jgi:hypothetical protein